MTISEKGKQFIISFEAIKLEAYKVTPQGNPTIGIGSEQYLNGQKVKMGDKITKEAAISLFEDTLPKYELYVKNGITQPLNQCQYNSLVSFVYNVGGSAFISSTLRRKININPNDLAIATEFAKWDKSGKKVLKGLTRRRAAESALYFS